MQIRKPVLRDVPMLVQLDLRGATHVLEKDGQVIGAAAYAGSECEGFVIAPQWQRHGYGTFFMRALLREQVNAPFHLWVSRENAAGCAFCEKLGFEQEGEQWRGKCDEVCFVRRSLPNISALTVAHQFLMQYGRRGGFAIDATAGNGHDTVFLARLVGEEGRVLALDVQPRAVEATRAAAQQAGCGARVHVVCETHAKLAEYAARGEVDIAVFNLGYLPGGDHDLFTTPEVSVPAIRTALSLLRRGGVLTACVYAGGAQGTRERDAVLAFFRALPAEEYTVLITEFAARSETQAIPVCVQKR
ncbi:MAG: GNAT family N-acetyltransferase [Ruthenibacterium sp.]